MRKSFHSKSLMDRLFSKRCTFFLLAVACCLLLSVRAFAGEWYKFDPNNHPVVIYPHFVLLCPDDSSLSFKYFSVDGSSEGNDVYDRWLAVILTAQSLNKSLMIEYAQEDGKVLSMYMSR